VGLFAFCIGFNLKYLRRVLDYNTTLTYNIVSIVSFLMAQNCIKQNTSFSHFVSSTHKRRRTALYHVSTAANLQARLHAEVCSYVTLHLELPSIFFFDSLDS